MGRNFRAEITENTQIDKYHFLLQLAPLEQTPEPRPGQFYMVGCADGYDPLLKRPFSVFSAKDGTISLLYRLKGKGTSLLSKKKPGDVLDVVGPLGNHYPLPLKDTALVVAGGMGIASVYPLIEKLRVRAHVIYGARSAEELLFVEEIRAMAAEVAICTDDGTYGHRGTVVNLLKDVSFEGRVLYACGPEVMLRAIAELSKEKNFSGYISLEERMACGVGACLGCAVKTLHGYKRVCKEGPVFAIGEIAWE